MRKYLLGAALAGALAFGAQAQSVNNPPGPLSVTAGACLTASGGGPGTKTIISITSPLSVACGGTGNSILSPTGGFLLANGTGAITVGTLCIPVVAVFTQGTGATYTTPTCNSNLPLYIDFTMCGGGGGGAGSGTTPGAASAGNNSTLGSPAITAGGGAAGTTTGASGAGGTVTGAGVNTATDTIIQGQQGGASGSVANLAGGQGGNSGFFNGGGIGGQTGANNGQAAIANTGGGGGGAGDGGTTNSGGGGAAGGCINKLLTGLLSSGYVYTVGTGGAGGTLGGSGAAGGNGAAGILRFISRWQ